MTSPPTSSPELCAGYETDRLKAWRRVTDGPLIVLAIGSLPLLALELNRSEMTSGDRLLLDAVNVAVLVAFAVDYVVELILASALGRTSGRSGRAC